MPFFTTNFLNARRQQWLDQIAKAQYRIGGTWYDGAITSRQVSGNSVVIMVSVTDPVSTTSTIVESRLIDNGGNVAGSRTENIVKNVNQGVLLKYEFPINEV